MKMSESQELAEAVSKGNLADVEALLKRGVSADWKDEEERDALYWAVSFCPSEHPDIQEKDIYQITKHLLSKGLSASSRYRFLGNMPAIVIAGMNGNIGSICSLIENDIDINNQDEAGFTALHRAAMNGWYDTVGLLLKSGAKKGIQNFYQETAFDLAKNAQREDSGAKAINRDFKKTIDLLS